MSDRRHHREAMPTYPGDLEQCWKDLAAGTQINAQALFVLNAGVLPSFLTGARAIQGGVFTSTNQSVGGAL